MPDIFTWTSHDELCWLASQAATHHCIVELGSYIGASAVAMANATQPDATLVCVDEWLDPWVERTFIANTGQFTNLSYMRGDTVESVLRAERLRGKIDLLFIDAGHDVHSVLSDLSVWEPMCAPGATICGHDWHDLPGDDAVKLAVEFYRRGLPVSLPCGSLWSYIL